MTNRYENPLCRRYASINMQSIFSDNNKFQTWRMLWVALAESQKELGLDISDEQIGEMKEHIRDIDFELAEKYEKETRHDVMAHIKTFAAQCPKAAPIIHLGATSCFVGDNADILMQCSAMLQIKYLLVNAIEKLSRLAREQRDLPCLAYTHFQAAQPTTAGKRVCLWIQDLMSDLEHLDFALSNIKLLGCKGTTGTAASFLALFDGDAEKVKLLEQKIVQKMEFYIDFTKTHKGMQAFAAANVRADAVYPVSGQTYSRKADYYTLSVLSGIAQSAGKFSNDIRLMSHLKEVDEPFEKGQVGSSAMAYKRNPMRSERIASLARYVMVNALNPALTAGAQWLERTLDDSANRRIAIPEAFLATDAILSLVINIAGGLTVYPKTIEKHLKEELPFMATENILMHCVRKGADRQELHERIRVHSVETAKRIKQDGGDNDLIERILADPAFGLTKQEMDGILRAENFTGMAAAQVDDYLKQVEATLEENRELLGAEVEVRV